MSFRERVLAAADGLQDGALGTRELIRWIAVAGAGVAVLTSCTTLPSPDSTSSSGSTDLAAPKSIDFAIAGEPSMTVDKKIMEQVALSRSATFVGDRLIIDLSSNGVAAFTLDDGAPVWALNHYGDKVGAGSTRVLPMRTSAAAGGIVLVAYSEDCVFEQAPCAGTSKGTRSIMGVAAVAARDGKVVWRSELATSGPPGSDTEDDGIYLEPEVVDADDDSVLVTLSSNRGSETPSGTAGMTTVLLNAETGREQWRKTGFRGGFLTDESVLGVAASGSAIVELHPNIVNAAVSRASGTKISLQVPTGADQWVAAANGPGAVMENRDEADVEMQTRNIYLIGSDGRRVPSGADGQNLATAYCPEYRTTEMLACVVTARSNGSILVTWAEGEDAPKTVAAPLPGHQQVWAVSGDIVLVSEHGFQNSPRDEPASWFAARRDGTVISPRYPGSAIAASPDHVLVKTLDPKGKAVFQVWEITKHP